MLTITGRKPDNGRVGPPLRCVRGGVSMVFVPVLHAYVENGGGLRSYPIDVIQVSISRRATPENVTAAVRSLVDSLAKKEFAWQWPSKPGSVFFASHVLFDLSELSAEQREAFERVILELRGGENEKTYELIAFRRGDEDSYVVAHAIPSLTEWSQAERVYGRPLTVGCTLDHYGAPVTNADGSQFTDARGHAFHTESEDDVMWTM